MKKEDGHRIEGTYILTCDLGSKIKLLKHIGFKTPDSHDTFYKDFQVELARLINRPVAY